MSTKSESKSITRVPAVEQYLSLYGYFLSLNLCFIFFFKSAYEYDYFRDEWKHFISQSVAEILCVKP